MAQVNAPRARALQLAIALSLQLGVAPAFAQQAPDLAQQAREAAWAGHTTQALRIMEQHLATHPDDRAARLDYARYLAWRGDYAGSIAALDALGSSEAEAQALRARVLAWDGRRDAALALNTPLYAADPQNYDVAWTQAVAARLGERPQEALPALARVRALKPDSRDTETLVKAVRLPLYSTIGVPLSIYSDSDDIEVRTQGWLEADIRVAENLRLLGSVVQREHSAPVTGPFAPVTGGDSIDEDRLQLGLRYVFSPDAALEFGVGRSRLDGENGDDDSDTIGRIAFVHQASDSVGYTLSAERDRVAFSPRSLSLGIMRDGVRGDLRWRPNHRDAFRASVLFDDFNDDNRRRWVTADWRHAIYRGERAMLDLGVQGDWMGFTRDPGNGYYSPDNYRRIAPVLGAYFKLSEEAGLSFETAVGVQRDETFDRWHRASDVGASLTLGIFTPWQLVASAGYSERLNEFGQYDGKTFGLTLRYRFCGHRPDECPR